MIYIYMYSIESWIIHLLWEIIDFKSYTMQYQDICMRNQQQSSFWNYPPVQLTWLAGKSSIKKYK